MQAHSQCFKCAWAWGHIGLGTYLVHAHALEKRTTFPPKRNHVILHRQLSVAVIDLLELDICVRSTDASSNTTGPW